MLQMTLTPVSGARMEDRVPNKITTTRATARLRLQAVLAGSLLVLTACGTNPVREPESTEYLCFGFVEHPGWSVLQSQSKLVSELRTVVAPFDPLAQSQAPSREVVIVSPRHRHAALCRLATLPSGKGCVAEKWYLYLDAHDQWFVSRHLAEACEVWEEIVVTS